MSAPQVKVGGTWLSSLAAVGDLHLTYRWPLGCWEASWSMALSPYEQPPMLVRDAAVTVVLGGGVVFAGELLEPDWAEARFVAAGACRSAESALCLTAAGKTTTVPNEAVDQAAARGMLTFGRGSTSLSSTAFAAGETVQLNTVAALLDAWAEEQGVRWYVGPDRLVRTATDPTTPRWYILPGAGELGVATETLAGRVVGNWLDADRQPQVTAVGSGRPEVAVDMTNKGRITLARATALLNSILAKAGPAAGSWTNGITVTRDQIITIGGVHPHLGAVASSVAGGAMMRLLDHRDPRNGLPYTDVVIGEAPWNVTDDTLTLNPVGLAARDLASIFARVAVQPVGT